MHGESGYGLWMLVLLNSAIFIFFAFSCFSLTNLSGKVLLRNPKHFDESGSPIEDCIYYLSKEKFYD